mmetsp:Transcript_12504/g.14315  ORF Transcript_12504/g.14315 Transcript_12504/m.14315 type:complete len:99 (+) Transcript_12504:355-651(+)
MKPLVNPKHVVNRRNIFTAQRTRKKIVILNLRKGKGEVITGDSKSTAVKAISQDELKEVFRQYKEILKGNIREMREKENVIEIIDGHSQEFMSSPNQS